MINISSTEAFMRFLTGMAIIVNILIFDLCEINLILFMSVALFLIISSVLRYCLIYDVLKSLKNKKGV